MSFDLPNNTGDPQTPNVGRVQFYMKNKKLATKDDTGNVTTYTGGDVDGPASSIDNSIPRNDGVTGKILQDSGVLIDDSDNIIMPALALVDGRDVSEDGAKLDGLGTGGGFNSSTWKSDITDFAAPPKDKRLEWNNATQSSATELFIDDNDKGGIDVSAFLSLISVGDHIRIQVSNDATVNQVFEVVSATDNTTYFTFGVTNISGIGGNISDNKDILVTFITAGDLPDHGDEHLTGGNDPIPLATQSVDGLFAAADKKKSDVGIGLISGILTGGDLTINGGDNSKVDLSAGTGVVINWTTPSTPVYTPVSWPEQLAITVTDIGTELFTIFYIDSSGTLQQIGGSSITPQLRRQNIVIDTASHPDMATVSSIAANGTLAYEASNSLFDYVRELGVLNSGNTMSANASDLAVQKSAGTSTLPWINKNTDPQNPSIFTNAVQTPLSEAVYSHQDGGGGFTILPGITVVDPDNYDDGSGSLAAVSNNDWTIQRIYFFGQNESTAIVYGQVVYNTLALAEVAIFSEAPVIDPLILDGAFVTALIVQEGATDLSNPAQAKFINISTETTAAGGGAGAQDLQSTYDLSDPNPEILTNSTQGALTVRRGSAADTDDVLQVQNGAAANVFAIDGEGNLVLSGLVDGRDVAADGIDIDANTAKVSNATHTGEVTGATTLTIANNAVITARVADEAITLPKLEHRASQSVLGRDSGGVGDVEAINMTTLRAMLGLGGNFLHSYDTTTQSISVANTFQALNFDTDVEEAGWTHAVGTNVFVCNKTAKYICNIDMTTQKTTMGGANMGFLASFGVASSEVEIDGSYFGSDQFITSAAQRMAHTFIFDGVAGQQLITEFYGSNTGSELTQPANPAGANVATSAAITMVELQE